MMTRKQRLTLATALFGFASAGLTFAEAGTDPLVVHGFGSDDAVPRAGRRAPSALALRPMQMAASMQSRPGQYGGGFIELLMTGSAPGRATALSAAPAIGLQYAPAWQPAEPRPGALYAHPAATQPRQMAYAPVEAAPKRGLDPRFLRQEVDYDGGHAPGTIVIDTPNKYLYLVQRGGRATRYGIGVGRPGFEWSGVKSISRKAEWPDWTPPAEMLLRRPDLPLHMDGGPANPLGARAMYLGSSLYRIHGTNEPGTIGTNVSSGCIRLTNDDVTDLYERVKVGAKVVVM
jgi:lipoprotein-anchoring transpeptidase ErfK/SrfK